MSSLPQLSKSEESRLLRNPDYEDRLLMEGGAWLLYLSDNQAHVGRAVAWLRSRHVDFHGFENLTVNESLELKMLITRYRSALTAVLGVGPALINCEWLGNHIQEHRGHGHMHLIPRYDKTPVFLGLRYPDTLFGKRSDYRVAKLDPKTFELLRDSLRHKLD